MAVLLRLLLSVMGVAGVAGGAATLTWYGSVGDGCLGARHGASWHGDSCGLSDLVDGEGFGAAAPRWVPYCSRLLVCSDSRPGVLSGHGCVVVVVVDRMRDDVLYGRSHLDLWPAPARALGVVGPGVVEGWFVLLR